MAFRRPELEKDNPMAPQPYVGPRRQKAKACEGSAVDFTEADRIMERLRALTEAASHFVNGLPKTRRQDKSLNVLRDAIAQAEQLLTRF